LKQNALPFLIKCCQQLNVTSQTSALEILWAMTFNNEAVQQLRGNPQALTLLQNISKRTGVSPEEDNRIQKAADGLIWKLVKGTNTV
jgi:hypothetical protein